MVILAIATTVSSQVIGTISSVSVNGVAIPTGTSINLGTNSQVNVKYFVSFTKPVNYVIGAMRLNSDTYKNGIYQINNTSIDNNWVDASIETSRWFEHIIYASDIDFGINNFLQAQLQKTLNPVGQWYSNRIKIIKIPTYTGITQSPALISCEPNNLVTFRLNSNAPNDASTYNWSYGTSWQLQGSTNGSSIGLIPVSYPLSDVTVVPSIHGATRGSYSKTPDLAPFTTTSTIQGQGNLCQGESFSYSLTNSASFASVTWSLTNGTSAATISNATNSSVTVNGLNAGIFYLYAVVTNQCGQLARIEKRILIGPPVATNTSVSGGQPYVSINSNASYSVSTIPDAVSYRWFISILDPQCGCVTDANGLRTCPSGVVFPKFTGSGNLVYNTPFPTVSVDWGNCPGNYVVNCLAVNRCGEGAIGHTVATVYNPSGGGGTNPNCPENLRIYPNPYNKATTTSNKIIIGNEPCPNPNPVDPYNNSRISLNQENTVKIYDFQGNFIHEEKFRKNEIELSNVNLKKGKYIVTMTSKNGTTSKEILVIE